MADPKVVYHDPRVAKQRAEAAKQDAALKKTPIPGLTRVSTSKSPAPSTSAFDELFASYQASRPKVSTVKPTISQDSGALTAQEQGVQHSYQSDAALRAATDAADQLKITMARYHAGAISKKDALQVFSDYQSKIDTLKSFDIIAAQNIQDTVSGKKPDDTQVTPTVQPQVPVGTSAPTNAPMSNTTATGTTTPVARPGGLLGPTGTVPGTTGGKKTGGSGTTGSGTSGGTGTGGGAGTSGGIGGVGSGNKGNNTPLTRQQYLDSFIATNPNEWSVIQSDPTLQKTFSDGLQKGWSAEKFQIEYEKSSYYNNHAGSWLDSAGARLGNGKGKWVETYNNALHDAQQLAIAQGLNLDPANFGVTPDNPTGKLKVVNNKIVGFDNNKPFVYDAKNPNLTSWVLDHYYNTGVGANATTITNYFATMNHIDPQHMSGVFGQNVDQLKSWANDFGMNNLLLKGNTNYFTDAANSIASGKQNLEYFHQDLMNQSAAAYPIYGNQIKAGLSLRSIASPYINTLSGLLETTPDNLDLSAPTGDGATIRRALQGNGVDTPTSLTDFATQVRQDPRWGKTLNAQNDVEATAHKILTDFGMAS